MAKIPQGWVECQLGDICNLDNGSKVYNVNLPLLDVKYLRGKKEAINVEKGVLLNNGDFVILVDGENSGEIFSIYEQGIMGSTFKKLIFSDYINVDFAKFKIMSKQKMFKLHKVGSAIPHLNKKLFKSLQLLLPPLNEQRRIVEKIESEFAKIDEGLEHLEHAKEQIKQYRQSVLKSAFEGKLTQQNPDDESAEILLHKINSKAKFIHNDNLPQGWIVCLLGEVCEVVTGSTPSTKNDNNYNSKDYPFFKPTDLNAGYYTNNSKDYVSEYAYDRARKLPKNSVLVTCIGATIGKTGIIRQAGICNQQINAILPNNYILPELLYWYCTSEHFQNLIKQTASATTLPILNKRNFEKLHIVFMPLNEQKKIVEEIDKRSAVADEVEKVVEDNIEKAKQLKQSILKKAFEGRLVPQDPNDKPATILLEKIKQERSKNAK